MKRVFGRERKKRVACQNQSEVENDVHARTGETYDRETGGHVVGRQREYKDFIEI